MIAEQFKNWLENKVLKIPYQLKPLELKIINTSDLILTDSLEQYKFTLKQVRRLEEDEFISINDYQFDLKFDFAHNQIEKIILDSQDIIIEFIQQQFSEKTTKLAKLYALRNEFREQIKNICIDLNHPWPQQIVQIEDVQQFQANIQGSIIKTPEKSIIQFEIPFFSASGKQPIHINSDIKPFNQNVMVSEKSQFSQKKLQYEQNISNIIIPEGWQQEADEWIKNRKREKKLDMKYYQKLKLLSEAVSKSKIIYIVQLNFSISKAQLVQNLLKYPYQPSDELKKKITPYLIQNKQQIGSEVYKKTTKYSKNIIEYLKKD